MDLIGDYAGSELFLLDGEALFQSVLNDPLLALGRHDDPSFQNLHAVWLLERLLYEFKFRDATFEIVFWQDGRHLTQSTGSVPSMTSGDFVVASRMLARSMMFRHLLSLTIPVRIFDNLADAEWIAYLDGRKVLSKKICVQARKFTCPSADVCDDH